MANPRFNDPIEPMDLANMRQNGVRSLAVQCHQCRHEVIMNVDHLPGDVTVPSFGPRMVCTKCGNWRERERDDPTGGRKPWTKPLSAFSRNATPMVLAATIRKPSNI